MLQLQEEELEGEQDEEDTSEEELVLSECVVQGIMGLQGLINNQQVLIIVDFGSSGNFIAEHLVQKLQLKAQATT